MSKKRTTKTVTKTKNDAPAAKATNGAAKKLSAIDAAAKVLGESKEPMNSDRRDGCEEALVQSRRQDSSLNSLLRDHQGDQR